MQVVYLGIDLKDQAVGRRRRKEQNKDGYCIDNHYGIQYKECRRRCGIYNQVLKTKVMTLKLQ